MDKQARLLLGEFLKTRRARLNPQQLGLPLGRRRRTLGLRREEVAQLAGVSTTWYTWIEQGRDIHFSDEVLRSLARVLQLPPHEKAYLFSLVHQQTEQTLRPQPTLSPTLRDIIHHQGIYPSYMMGRYWEILAWNQSAVALFGDFATMPVHEQHMIGYTFARPATRQLVVNWSERAPRLLAEFRADCSAYLHEPALQAIIQTMQAYSPEFADCWIQHDIGLRDGGKREFKHPQVGLLAFEQTTFRIASASDLKMVIHVPLEEHDTTQKLLTLV